MQTEWQTVLTLFCSLMQGFHKNSMSSFGGDAITVKIKDGCWRPYLSRDRNHFPATQLDQSDQGLHCLPFSLHLLYASLYGKTHIFTMYQSFVITTQPHLQGIVWIITFHFSETCYNPHNVGTNWRSSKYTYVHGIFFKVLFKWFSLQQFWSNPLFWHKVITPALPLHCEDHRKVIATHICPAILHLPHRWRAVESFLWFSPCMLQIWDWHSSLCLWVCTWVGWISSCEKIPPFLVDGVRGHPRSHRGHRGGQIHIYSDPWGRSGIWFHRNIMRKNKTHFGEQLLYSKMSLGDVNSRLWSEKRYQMDQSDMALHSQVH